MQNPENDHRNVSLQFLALTSAILLFFVLYRSVRGADGGQLPERFEECPRWHSPAPYPGLPVIDYSPLRGVIEKGDLIEMVTEVSGPNVLYDKRAHVASDGSINLMGVRVRVAGLTPEDVSQAVDAAFNRSKSERPAFVVAERLSKAKDEVAHAGPITNGDLLEVALCDLIGPDLVCHHYVRVEADGKIYLPLIKPIAAAGLEEVSLEEVIDQTYSDGGIAHKVMASVLHVMNAKDMLVGLGGIKAGDLLRVTITGLVEAGAETTFDLRVTRDGQINLPLLNGVAVAGLSESDAARLIGRAYEDRKIINEEPIWVLRIESGREVRREGEKIMPGDMVEIFIGGDLKFGCGPWRRATRINDQGNIYLPLVGSVRLMGLSDLGAQGAIEAAYHALGIKKPSIAVGRFANKSEPITKSGGRPAAE